MRIISRFAFIVLPLCLLALPAAARAAGPDSDVYFGYSRLGANAFHANTPGLNGWEAEGQVKFIPFIGVDGDLAHYGLGAAGTLPHTTTVMIGPRLTVGAAGVHVYGHALFGAEHSSNSGGIISSTAITVDAGAGVDFRLLPMFAWRVNGDYINAPNQSPGSADHYRFGTGLVFRF
jgi:hypothetical protein